jgi:hypothetical protein
MGQTLRNSELHKMNTDASDSGPTEMKQVIYRQRLMKTTPDAQNLPRLLEEVVWIAATVSLNTPAVTYDILGESETSIKSHDPVEEQPSCRFTYLCQAVFPLYVLLRFWPQLQPKNNNS